MEQWKLGRKGVDDGILLLIAKNDRKLRIEVGRGLEGVLPDAIAKRIIDEYITPQFKKGDFNGGVNAGVDRIIKVVDGESLPAPSADQSRRLAMDDVVVWGPMLVLFLLGALRAMLGSFFGAILGGGFASAVAYFFGASPMVCLFVGIFVFTFHALAGAGTGRSGRKGRGSGRGYGGSFGGGGASGSW